MKTILAVILIAFNCNYSKGQIITTIAGNGIAGYNGDNGLAISAELNVPVNVTSDHFGNVFIADIGNHCVRKINSAGIITTIAGTGTPGYNGDGILATAAELHGPYAITIDKIGNLFIADDLNYRIRKIDTFGIIHTIAGNGNTGFSGDNGPATDAEFSQPTGVTVDSSGNIYVADWLNNRIRKIDTSDTITTIAGTGSAGYSGDGGPAIMAAMTMPDRVISDGFGNLYVSDFYRVRKINSFGIIYTLAGNDTSGYNGDNIPATAAELNGPAGIAVSSNGAIYISDSYNNRIRKIDTNGIITTIAGNGIEGFSGDGGPADSAEISLPDGVVFDQAGNLLFTEFGGNRVRKIIYNLGVPVMGGKRADVKVYPNPTNSTLYFVFPSSGSATIKLMDITGRIMDGQVVNSVESASVNVKNYTPGIYLYQVVTNNATYTGKIVVGH